MDKISTTARSRNMSKIRAKNTIPELKIRKFIFSRGYRYRIHYPIAGKPDIVFPKIKKAIFIHGCFWHGHRCKTAHEPKTNSQFWIAKIRTNRKRDKKNLRQLKRLGWQTLVLWECQINNGKKCFIILSKFIAS